MRALTIILAFFGGLVATYVLAVAMMLAYMSVAGIVDRDGGMSMGIIFGIGPLCGIVGGVVMAVAIGLRLRRRDRQREPAAAPPPAHRWPPNKRAAVAAACWGVGAFILAFIAIRFFRMSFSTYEMALAVGMSPYALGLAAAGLAALAVLRKARREAG